MRIAAEKFGLACSLECGQVFGWRHEGGWFYGFVEGKPVKIRRRGRFLEWTGRAGRKTVRRCFRLNDDLEEIYAAIARDKTMRNAVTESSGLRLLRQDPWECSVSYICSANSNIPNINRMLDNLRAKFGRETKFNHVKLHSFPTPKQLAQASMADLRKCGLGFRAPYVRDFARNVVSGKIDFKALRRLSYEKAKEALVKQRGIGPKVADCILLFSLDKLDAFPVDVWIRRMMLKYYSKQVKAVARRPKISDDDIRSFARRYFGGYAGYAQEYLFAARCRCRR
jgi:N-glycosylase/DNA lyase